MSIWRNKGKNTARVKTTTKRQNMKGTKPNIAMKREKKATNTLRFLPSTKG